MKELPDFTTMSQDEIYDYMKTVSPKDLKAGKTNYVIITVGYSAELVFSWADGIAFYSLLQKAEYNTYHSSMGTHIKDSPTERVIKLEILPEDVYCLRKMSTLLGINCEEVAKNRELPF